MLRQLDPKGQAWIFMKEKDGHAVTSWEAKRALTPQKIAALGKRRKPDGPPQMGLFD